MELNTTLDIVSPQGAIVRHYTVPLGGSIQHKLCGAYERAELEGVPREVLNACTFRLPRMLRSSLTETKAGYRTYPAPRARRKST